MREIKFRAWDNKNGGYFFCMQSIHFDKEIGITVLSTIDSITLWGDDILLEQFTGLRDKNGREIYEGDIVESKIHNPSKMEIRFIEGGFCAWWGDDDYPIDINHFYDSKGCCIEVIGNIHENIDLLK